MIIVSITGCIFVFEEEIRNFTQKEYRFVSPQNKPKATIEQLTATLKTTFPDKQIEQIRLFDDASRTVIAKLVAKKAYEKKAKKTMWKSKSLRKKPTPSILTMLL
ncbi:MAG: hypothetical protein U5L45_11780 [Saprospiraceae bacterium]|nr:hypothetical protein [Saprospiraceae bacterium]